MYRSTVGSAISCCRHPTSFITPWVLNPPQVGPRLRQQAFSSGTGGEVCGGWAAQGRCVLTSPPSQSVLGTTVQLAAAAELAVLATAKNAARRSITIVYVSYCPPDPGRQQQRDAVVGAISPIRSARIRFIPGRMNGRSEKLSTLRRKRNAAVSPAISVQKCRSRARACRRLIKNCSRFARN
jgi:hypothetical protein